MKREEKSGERTAEKGENLGKKWMRRRGGGQTTPIVTYSTAPPLYWQSPFHIDSVISVRKLAATLWELDNYNLPLYKMHNNNNNNNGVGGRLLRRHHQVYEDKGGGLEIIDPSPNSQCQAQPGSCSSLRRLVAASLRQHHRAIDERRTSNHNHNHNHNHPMQQPLSPASYASSMEIAPYNPALTPTSSIELTGRNPETSYSLRTSTELLKVLNRIWSLEEQHISNITLVRALKKELDHARSRIKELVREQHTDRHEMDELMKQITEDKLLRKNKEQDRMNSVIQSMRDELEDERKLRKRSESLHRKLAKELYDVKTTLVTVTKDLEKERESRNLLEELCDEFAWGIRDYEKEFHLSVREISDRNNHDKLILHVSESWLDERMQGEKKSAVDKLRSEIEDFLKTKRSSGNRGQIRDPTLRRSSLESIPMNTTVSAPPREEDEYDSAGSDSNCFELEKMFGNEYPKKNHIDETVKQKQVKKIPGPSELRETGISPSSLQVKFTTHMAQATTHGESTNRVENPSVETKPEKCESSEKKHESEVNTGSKTNSMMENLIRNHYLLSESEKMQNKEYGVSSSTTSNAMWRSHPSPVRHWTEKLPTRNLNDSTLKMPGGELKESSSSSSVKGKLLFGGRTTKGQRSRTRPKASIAPS